MSIINNRSVTGLLQAGRSLSAFYLKGLLKEYNATHNPLCKGKFRGGGFLWVSVWIGLRRCGILTVQHKHDRREGGTGGTMGELDGFPTPTESDLHGAVSFLCLK